ncbi:glutaredoxin domain-containing protein [uncultured Thermanaerothrix sp.]|uniref:glutaredoxin family protein n=1 Tax=uncultured Thermanaerothrix sp. TaxID=1195149 RepID=UPI00260BF579|nr:glutaredoxin domain-containing protein [uncultured Thermanaerothrix sp.]
MKIKRIENPPTIITLYGTTWCYGSRQARALLDQEGIPYHWIDIDRDLEARRVVEIINEGFRSVPTLVFPDGSVLVEPDLETLAAHLKRFKLPPQP